MDIRNCCRRPKSDDILTEEALFDQFRSGGTGLTQQQYWRREQLELGLVVGLVHGSWAAKGLTC